ncbi:Nucleolar complex-associated protein 3 [Salvia divinorum]|uniref:Nucleolar complex-associated protein 3 n=1 Tax=Salvia divinorum TaxID=28513 RepID=A0ABD1HTQ3_SALDI
MDTINVVLTKMQGFVLCPCLLMQPNDSGFIFSMHDEVKKKLRAEEAKEKKKYKFAELGTTLLTDPESNIKLLKEMLEISKDEDSTIVIIGLKSLLAVFKDIIPGYRIRLPTEKEQEMKVSNDVKKMRFYESTLLSVYKLIFRTVPHFNYRKNLLAAVVKDISSQDDVVRKLCCTTVKSLFIDEGKHGSEVTVEAVRRIAELVKTHNCQLHPNSLEVFLSLSFDEDLGKSERFDIDKKSQLQKI